MINYEEWHESKKELPPLGEVVECMGPKGWIYSRLGRDYFCLVAVGEEIIWITPSSCDYKYNELDITHWRFIQPDAKGKKPYIKIKYRKHYYEPIVYFLKS
jgi:hypothetical protein